jgi:hypothetical protein
MILRGKIMTREEFKAYLDMIVEKAFKEGVLYEQNRRKFGFDENFIAMEMAIDNAKTNILGE